MRFTVAAAALLVLTACADSTDPLVDPSLDRQGSSGFREYDVTITNLTTGQPLSPPAVVVHSPGRSIFTVGAAASEGIRQIAENGDPSYLVSAVAGTDGIGQAFAATVPIHRIGGPGPNSITVKVQARGQVNRLSLATMLICTNDGFTGLDGVVLSARFKPVSYHAAAYDAGTEMNTEADGDIVPPCFGIGPVGGTGGGGRTAEHEVIRHHPGIVGGAALTSAHQWGERIIRVTIVRTK